MKPSDRLVAAQAQLDGYWTSAEQRYPDLTKRLQRIITTGAVGNAIDHKLMRLACLVMLCELSVRTLRSDVENQQLTEGDSP